MRMMDAVTRSYNVRIFAIPVLPACNPVRYGPGERPQKTGYKAQPMYNGKNPMNHTRLHRLLSGRRFRPSVFCKVSRCNVGATGVMSTPYI